MILNCKRFLLLLYGFFYGDYTLFLHLIVRTLNDTFSLTPVFISTDKCQSQRRTQHILFTVIIMASVHYCDDYDNGKVVDDGKVVIRNNIKHNF